MKHKIIAIVFAVLMLVVSTAPLSAGDEKIAVCRDKSETIIVYGFIVVGDIGRAAKAVTALLANGRCVVLDMDDPTVYYLDKEWAIVEVDGELYWAFIRDMKTKYLNRLKRSLKKNTNKIST